MHYGNGAKSVCRDLEAKELQTCSDVNTTLFVERLLAAEKPDLVVFTGVFHWVLLYRSSAFLDIPTDLWL